jgi:hypothetical protein
MEMLPRYNEPFVLSQREVWANDLARALIQIRVQGKQSECKKKVNTALEIAQVLYDAQFVTYLKKTFLEETQSDSEQKPAGRLSVRKDEGEATPKETTEQGQERGDRGERAQDAPSPN